MKNILIVFAASLILVSCASDKRKPGRVFMPDMHYSNAYETYATELNPNFWEKSDKPTVRLPVENTIPRGAIPQNDEIRNNEAYLASYTMINHMDLTKDNYQANYDYAAASYQNPIPLTKEMMAGAKVNYERFCGVCHGKKGAGDGSIVVMPDGSDGPYTAIPPAYEVRLPTITDGAMFFSISQGKGMMGGYGPQLTVKERWELVHYIKDLAGMYNPEDFVEATPEMHGDEHDGDHHHGDGEHEGEDHHEDHHEDGEDHDHDETMVLNSNGNQLDND